MQMTLSRISFTALGLLAILVAPLRGDEEDQPPAPAPIPDQATLDRKFEELLTGCVLVGSFTTTGAGKDKELTTEKYTIERVKKLKGDLWLFTARLHYGDNEVSIPLPLEVKWAGDTPVITLTDLEIPNLGKYTARVLFYQDHYAGFWSGGDHGGHLFGKIERPKDAKIEGKAPSP